MNKAKLYLTLESQGKIGSFGFCLCFGIMCTRKEPFRKLQLTEVWRRKQEQLHASVSDTEDGSIGT